MKSEREVVKMIKELENKIKTVESNYSYSRLMPVLIASYETQIQMLRWVLDDKKSV